MTIDQIDAFARRVIVNLPDSLEQQKNDLAVLAHLLPHQSLGHIAAKGMLDSLLAAEKAQSAFVFSSTPKHDGRRDGHQS